MRPCFVAEILMQIPQLFGQLCELVAPCAVDFVLRGVHILMQQVGDHQRGVRPRDRGAVGRKRTVARRDTDTVVVIPQGVFLPRDGDALAARAKFPPQKLCGIGKGRVFLKMRHDALNAVLAVTASGQRAPDHSVGDAVGPVQTHLRRDFRRRPLFLGLRLRAALDLFLNRGKQRKTRRGCGGFLHFGRVRASRRRSGGHIARRFVFLLSGCYL